MEANGACRQAKRVDRRQRAVARGAWHLHVLKWVLGAVIT